MVAFLVASKLFNSFSSLLCPLVGRNSGAHVAQELKERVKEMERHKSDLNLKIHGMKEKDDESTRDIVMGILSKVVPQ